MLLERIFAKDSHIDHQRRAYRSLQNMAGEYGQVRLENACACALSSGASEMMFVRTLLRNHRETLAPTGTDDTDVISKHANLRSGSEFTLHIVEKRNTNAD
jgi:hypothetical protein